MVRNFIELELENELLREENENLKEAVRLLHDEHFQVGVEYIYEPQELITERHLAALTGEINPSLIGRKRLQRQFTMIREKTTLAQQHERSIGRTQIISS